MQKSKAFGADLLEKKAGKTLVSRDQLSGFKKLFEKSLDGVVVNQDSGVFIYANQVASRIFQGHPADYFIRAAHHFHKLDHPETKRNHEQFLKKGNKKGEIELNLPGGKKIFLEFISVANFVPGYHVSFIRDVTIFRKSEKIKKQNQTELQLLVRDQTKELREINRSLKQEVKTRKRAEEQLEYQKGKVERQKNRLLAIFDHVEEGVVIMDDQLRVTLANPKYLEMAGLRLGQILGKKYYRIFNCQDKNGNKFPTFDPSKEVFRTKKPITYNEHIHETKTGEKRWVGVSLTPILDKDKKVHQIVSVIRDVTASKELETAKSEFVSMASHELRTPLTVISGYLSLLLNGDLGSLSDKKGQQGYFTVLTKVFNETKRLTKLAEELLNVSRIEGGQVRLRPARISLDQIVHEVMLELDSLAREKDMDLKIRSDSETPHYLYADRDKLKQILVNLVDNAIKYSDPSSQITVSYTQKEDNTMIQVTDTGPGIPLNLLPKIFDKFQQGNGSYLKENKGTGLGLYIVKSLVELHQGKIWVHSKQGVGTTFTFTLPLVRDLN